MCTYYRLQTAIPSVFKMGESGNKKKDKKPSKESESRKRKRSALEEIREVSSRTLVQYKISTLHCCSNYVDGGKKEREAE